MSRSKLIRPCGRLLLSAGLMSGTEQGLRQLVTACQQGGVASVLGEVSATISLLNFRAWSLNNTRGFAAAAADKGGRKRRERDEGLVAAEEEFSAITDKIPQRPITVVEGTSYTVLIVAALGFAAAVVYAALNELVFSPKEYVCYTKTLNKIKDDPRVTVRLGTPVSAYGTESRNRAARQRIPHRIYNDSEGREHIQLQFHMKGPNGRATVNADMYKDGSNWRYNFLYLNVESPVPQQVVFIRPGQVDDY